MKALHDLGVAESSRALAAGQVSSLELTEHLLALGHRRIGYAAANDDLSLCLQSR